MPSPFRKFYNNKLLSNNYAVVYNAEVTEENY